MKKTNVNSGMGISMLIMIFTVLCITIFASLTYLQANYNYTEAKNIVSGKEAYFEADYHAVEKYRELKEALEKNEITMQWLEEKKIDHQDGKYTYSIKINENQSLKVELSETLEIEVWQKVTTTDGDYDFESFVD